MTAEPPEAPKMGEPIDLRCRGRNHVEVMDAIEARLHSDGVPPETVEIVARLDFCQGLRHVAAMASSGRMEYRMITGKVDIIVASPDATADRIVVLRLDTTPLFEVLLG